MIKILVCFTCVPNLEMLSEADWVSGCSSGTIDTSFLKRDLNSFDESALEIICRFADRACQKNIDCRRACVTIGQKNAEQTLRTLAALGFSSTDRICCDNEETLSGESAARILAEYIKQEGSYDLIVMGSQSSAGNSKKTPFALSEYLGLTCISQMTDISPADEYTCLITRDQDGYRCVEEVQFPALVTVGTVPSTYLRVPTIRDRVRIRPDCVRHFSIQDLVAGTGTAEPGPVYPVSIRPAVERRISRTVSGTPQEQARELYDNYLKIYKQN